MFPSEAIVAALVARGELWETTPGIIGLRGDTLALFAGIERAIARLASAETTDEWRVPSAIPLTTLARAEYFASFPQWLTLASHLDDDQNVLQRLAEHADPAGAARDAATRAEAALPPAVCYHAYAALAGRAVASPKLLSSQGTCWRHEGARHAPLERGWAFTMREIVCLGNAEDTAAFRARGIRRAIALAEELEVLAPAFDGTVALVSSGGCTALSLVAAGASDLVAIDLNPAQNHLVELKAAAVAQLGARVATAFLGGWEMLTAVRRDCYRALRRDLTPPARAFWNARPASIGRGVLGAGASERFMAGVAAVMRAVVHRRERIDRLFGCRTLDEQRALYWREWNSIRWRLLFSLLVTRRGLERTYDAALCSDVAPETFGTHFHALLEHGLTALPVADNYFLHQALLGSYPEEGPDALPRYLLGGPGDGRLRLVDGGFTDFLRTQPIGSISGFALSNICEWLDPAGVDALFQEIVRTATPNAVLCFRNFVGWTEVPERWRAKVVEDRARGQQLLARDRSLVNRRFAVCRILPEGR